ncbi:Oidioi.mRNA.OKI2018_I69.PAR.g9992.t1.cds [Oikopleura dioica]|uniref:Oidioi.mRNA.OKI2018_I69.PAR.g9992.t1.cds n=1 Tax=Oikopleura dioica TaxID=34765 RepID=A0ABN7RSP0_OIKDI|nr:Oidioi.mRNA.OKI2018_I69.PAR.g9992.t1.cds [Oikopleura dioica]
MNTKNKEINYGTFMLNKESSDEFVTCNEISSRAPSVAETNTNISQYTWISADFIEKARQKFDDIIERSKVDEFFRVFKYIFIFCGPKGKADTKNEGPYDGSGKIVPIDGKMPFWDIPYDMGTNEAVIGVDLDQRCFLPKYESEGKDARKAQKLISKAADAIHRNPNNKMRKCAVPDTEPVPEWIQSKFQTLENSPRSILNFDHGITALRGLIEAYIGECKIGSVWWPRRIEKFLTKLNDAACDPWNEDCR